MEPNTPATQAFPQESPIQDSRNPSVGRSSRPKGPNASAVVLGLLALVLGGAIMANESMGTKIDWSAMGPGAIVGIGVLLVVLGGIGLIRRKDGDA